MTRKIIQALLIALFVAPLLPPAVLAAVPDAALEIVKDYPFLKAALTDDNYLAKLDPDQPDWQKLRTDLGSAAFRKVGSTRSVRVEMWRGISTEYPTIVLEYQTSFKKFPQLPAQGTTQTDPVASGVGRDAMWHRTFYGGTDDEQGRKEFEQLMIDRAKLASNRRTTLDPKFVELAEKYLPNTPLDQVHDEVKGIVEKLVEACKPIGAQILSEPQYGPFGAKITDHLYLYIREFPRGASRSAADPFFWLIISGGPKAWPNDYIPAFPGAEGMGARATGGRGGKVIYVTTTNSTGPGSLAEALATKGPRIVLFKVSGQIAYPEMAKIAQANGGANGRAISQDDMEVWITEPDCTLIGSTAPGEGVEITARLGLAADNIIIRNMKFRLRPPRTKDGTITKGNLRNIIFDHCSFAYDTDEQLRMIGNGTSYSGFTIQYCLLGPGLGGTGDHPYGPEVGGYGTFHHNLFYSTLSRSPEVDCDLIDWRNNIMANLRRGHSDRPRSRFNMVGNYIVDIPGNYNAGYNFDTTDAVFSDGNFRERGGEIGPFNSRVSQYLKNPYPAVPITIDKPAFLEAKLAPNVGAFLPSRDSTDKHFLEAFKARKLKLPFFQRPGEPWRPYGNENDNPQLYEPWEDKNYPPPAPGATPAVDSDNDGMPDEWETANKLNPNDASDGAADADKDGYTNVEEFLNKTDPNQLVDYKDPTNNKHSLHAN